MLKFGISSSVIKILEMETYSDSENDSDKEVIFFKK